MFADKNIYAHKAVSQIPRVLSLQDRNSFSPTYGCFHRDYWLYKTSDFPDAVRQFGIHALALVYTHEFPNNIYQGEEKILDWTIAGLSYWCNLQHRDGSFDEFYPFERGWVGPTAFTTFTAIETYKLLKNEISADAAQKVLDTIERSARFIAAGETEEDHLANHHAMACLAVWKAYEVLDDPSLKLGFEKLWDGFLDYHQPDEGWSREYDGVDPGYLSATVSFLAKIYQNYPDPDILEVMQQSVEFCSYFVYPNGFYGGSLGSRNTLHFYPHGFEIMADEIPLAGAIAEKMLQALGEDKLVPPEIMSDRYVFYRVPEFLQAHVDYSPRTGDLPDMPFEQEPFEKYFPKARISVINTPNFYGIANLAKGGVVKVFDTESRQIHINDCGILGILEGGKVVTSQWVDPEFDHKTDEMGWEVSGYLHEVPSNKLFTPFKNILFRAALFALGWIPQFSHFLKGSIRKTLMLGRRPTPIKFSRKLKYVGNSVELENRIELVGGVQVSDLMVGDEFFVRYVPQSRFFQSQEIQIQGQLLNQDQINKLNLEKSISIKKVVKL